LATGVHFILEVDMTSGHVLLVGDDLCARANVLEHVGYLVACCACEADALRKTLVHSVDAVLFQCMPEPPSPALLSTCSALTHAPIVLFADSNSAFNSSDFDLVVPNLCNPREWLPKLAETIASSRGPEFAKLPQRALPIEEKMRKQPR
jgi:hypothetical protein